MKRVIFQDVPCATIQTEGETPSETAAKLKSLSSSVHVTHVALYTFAFQPSWSLLVRGAATRSAPAAVTSAASCVAWYVSRVCCCTLCRHTGGEKKSTREIGTRLLLLLDEKGLF